MKKETFDVFGMTCAACQAAVERSVSHVDGVESVDVSLIGETMKVEYDPEKTTPEQIEQAVDQAGYKAAQQQQVLNEAAASSAADVWENRRERMEAETKEKKRILIVSLVLLAVLMCFSMLPMLGVFSFLMSMEWMMVDVIIQLALTMLILFFQRSFFIHGFKALFKRNPNMDSLVAIGSAVSFAYGFYGMMVMAHGYGLMDHAMVHSSMNALYFESAAMIVTLVSLGKYLEARSKSKTGDALASLVKLAPKTALVARGDAFIEIAADQVITGDLVKIVPGASIPVDGIVQSGWGSVDQSALTGESIPVDKNPGDPVLSATTNLNGSFLFEATSVGSDTTLAKIITLVDDAGSSKAPIARLADKVSGIFVPTVLVLALLTLVGWLIAGKDFGFAFNCAVSVLVISCPCALGLATPLAIMVATGKAASNGILIKSAAALETLAGINTVVLDKTGTITQGKPAVAQIKVLRPSCSEERFLSLAAAAESGSEHPLARAVLVRAEQQGLTLPPATDFEAFGGRGLQAKVDGVSITAGNLAFMNEQKITIGASAKADAEAMADAGGTPLYFAFDGELTGLISVADPVRATSRQAISLLRKQRMEVIMLTGDNAKTARAIASGLDLSDVISDVLPADKEAVIRQLQDKGRKVAMVGDGINDAPALMRADVGIAIGAGTDIAIDAADIVLMKDSLLDVVTAVDLARGTLRNIRENLFWAFFYNCLGIPLAAGLFYPITGWLLNPMFGAAAMSLSSVTVCLNALRLRLFKPRFTPVAESEEKPAAVHSKPAVDPVSAVPAESETNESETTQSTAVESRPVPPYAALFSIDGMSCMHCVAHVSEALQKMNGITQVEVTLEPAQAYMAGDQPLDPAAIASQIEQAGYATLPPSLWLDIPLNENQRPHNGAQLQMLLEAVKSHQAAWVLYDRDRKTLRLSGEPIPSRSEIETEIGRLPYVQRVDETKKSETKEGEFMKLTVEGMSCAHCAARVEKALEGVAGVTSAKVDLAARTATVEGSNLDASALAKAVSAAGYAVTDID